jgi:hypothetical protein
MHGLRIELNVLSVLHEGKCGDRVVSPLAVVRWPGRWYDSEADREQYWWQVSH